MFPGVFPEHEKQEEKKHDIKNRIKYLPSEYITLMVTVVMMIIHVVSFVSKSTDAKSYVSSWWGILITLFVVLLAYLFEKYLKSPADDFSAKLYG